MVVLGLSGGIGSGKSTVAGILARFFRAAVFDADKEVHHMYLHDAEVNNLVREYFPDCICDGAVSRKKLTRHFLSHNSLWRRFQSIIHSIVLKKQRRFLSDCSRAGCNYVVLDVPLLLEAGFWYHCNFIVHVDVSYFLQRRRLSDRGFSEAEISFLLSLQIPREKRRNFADFCVNCGRSAGEVLENVLQIVRHLDPGRRNYGSFGDARKRLASTRVCSWRFVGQVPTYADRQT
ncbi:MAG: dephospho-CoA kinase [Anaplasma sp.]